MEKKKALEVLKRTGVMQEEHFLLTSGRHADKYMQCARLFEYPQDSEMLSRDIADYYRDKDIQLVVGPALGGIILSYEVSRQLGVRNIFAERQNGVMTIRRGFTVKPGTRVLVVEDVVTTGGSVVEVIDLLKVVGAEVVGVGLIVDRSNGEVQFGCDKHAVITMKVDSWEAEDCPLCNAGASAPIKPGSRGA